MNENPSTLSNTTQLSHDEISRKAKELWENYGRPEGRDDEIWLEAERSLAGTSSPRTSEERPVDTPMKNTSAITATTGIASAGRSNQTRGAKSGRK